jgi:protein-L-isoaspartate(D-aspartate) O-methyltransferase
MKTAGSALGAVVVLLLSWTTAGSSQTRAEPDWAAQRKRMVEQQLRARDIVAPRVLNAMLAVPRHAFVPDPKGTEPYGDFPLPIGYSQTISQPYIVGFMTQALDVQAEHKVLEIGTGSGYQAAVLGQLAKVVYTIEIVPPLAARARETLKSLGTTNVHVRTGNGYLGWPEEAPFDRIIVTAAPDEVPSVLVEQLKVGGRLVVPVGTVVQELRVLRRTASGTETLDTLPVRFVPMTGKPKPVG